jgi:hypothetical protein
MPKAYVVTSYHSISDPQKFEASWIRHAERPALFGVRSGIDVTVRASRSR